MSKSPTPAPNVAELVKLLREATLITRSASVSALLSAAADVLSEVSPGDDLSEAIATPRHEKIFLARIEALMPEYMTPRQMSLLFSYILHRYRVSLVDTDVVLAHVRSFLRAQQEGPEAQGPGANNQDRIIH
jgi:hypothetical protein